MRKRGTTKWHVYTFIADRPIRSLKAKIRALTRGKSQQDPRNVLRRPPTHYKTGIAFLSWLNGHQPGFAMAGGLHAGRSVPHLAEVFRLADRAGRLTDPDRAAGRMKQFLAVQGVEQ